MRTRNLFVRLLITCGLTLVLHGAALSATVGYFNENGNPLTTEALPITSETSTLTDGFYFISGTVNVPERLEVSGVVSLILCDNSELSAQKGISVNEGNSLTVYRQQNRTGKLTAKSEAYNSAIGGDNGHSAGTITINGGIINAEVADPSAKPHANGAAIGGGALGHSGTITINGGAIAATGARYGAGIGGGSGREGLLGMGADTISSDGSITINGGEIAASSRAYGAGIGGGYYRAGGEITINGGLVKATGGKRAAGIGGGEYSAAGTITINNADSAIPTIVYANGGKNDSDNDKYSGAGIGAGFLFVSALIKANKAGTVAINDGVVLVTAENQTPAIGDPTFDLQNANARTPSDIWGLTFSSNSQKFLWLNASKNLMPLPLTKGIVFNENDGQVFGAVRLPVDRSIPAGKTLTIPEGASLTVPAGITLSILSDAKLVVAKGADLTVEGRLAGYEAAGRFENNGTFTIGGVTYNDDDSFRTSSVRASAVSGLSAVIGEQSALSIPLDVSVASAGDVSLDLDGRALLPERDYTLGQSGDVSVLSVKGTAFLYKFAALVASLATSEQWEKIASDIGLEGMDARKLEAVRLFIMAGAYDLSAATAEDLAMFQKLYGLGREIVEERAGDKNDESIQELLNSGMNRSVLTASVNGSVIFAADIAYITPSAKTESNIDLSKVDDSYFEFDNNGEPVEDSQAPSDYALGSPGGGCSLGVTLWPLVLALAFIRRKNS